MKFAKDKTNLTIHLKMYSMSAPRTSTSSGNDLPTAEQPGLGAMAVVHGDSEEHPPQGPAPGRCPEHHSRRRVLDHEGLVGLELCPTVFRQINQTLGFLEVDLFASLLTHQLQTYVSWRPDPMAMDAFTLDWAKLRPMPILHET